jgi:hypothetical protein
VLLPVDPRLPRFDRIGHASTPMHSLAVQVLVLVLFLSGLLTFTASRLILDATLNARSEQEFLAAGVFAAIMVISITVIERKRIRNSLRKAEEES